MPNPLGYRDAFSHRAPRTGLGRCPVWGPLCSSGAACPQTGAACFQDQHAGCLSVCGGARPGTLVPTPPSSLLGSVCLYLHHDVLRPQEWIKDTQNVGQGSRTEDREQECSLEDTLLVLLPKAEGEAPGPPPPGSPPVQKEAPEDPSQVPGQPPRGELLSLSGFTFVMSENSYVTL